MKGQEALTLVDNLLHSANRGQRLTDVQSVVFLETWVGRSYQEIAEQLGYQLDYIKQIGSRLWRSLSQTLGEPVSKQNVKAVLRHYQQSQTSRGKSPCFPGGKSSCFPCDKPLCLPCDKSPCLPCTQDWGEAIDVSQFYGRQAELQTLETWILSHHTRLIGIFGLGGIGKTALSVKLAQQVQSQFECVIWRSLQQAPSFSSLLSEILPILAGTEIEIDSSINTLMKQLRSKRCLLVLDNIESILQGGNRSGQYQQEFEAYRQLVDRICDESHQSYLIITGRDKPSGLSMREGKNLPVRSLQLQGLSGKSAQQILIAKGLEAPKSQCQTLVNYFGGNPFALKLAATTIQSLFGGSIQSFLAQGRTVFSDLWDLHDQQFQRLSPLQQQIMYSISINHKEVTPAKLHEQIMPRVPWRELLEALESLQERSLIKTENQYLTQQPVIMEYVTERFIQTLEQDLIVGSASCPSKPCELNVE